MNSEQSMKRVQEVQRAVWVRARQIEWVKRHYKFNDYCYIRFKDSYVLARFLSLFLLFLVVLFLNAPKCLSPQMNTNECERERESARESERQRFEIAFVFMHLTSSLSLHLDHWHCKSKKNARAHTHISTKYCLNCRCASASAFTTHSTRIHTSVNLFLLSFRMDFKCVISE